MRGGGERVQERGDMMTNATDGGRYYRWGKQKYQEKWLIQVGQEGQNKMCNQRRILGPERSLSEVGTPPPNDSDTPHELLAGNTTTIHQATVVCNDIDAPLWDIELGGRRQDSELPPQQKKIKDDFQVTISGSQPVSITGYC